MRLLINARGMDLDRGFLDKQLRLGVGAWSARIRRVRLSIEDVNGPKGGLDRRCGIDALLIPAGRLAVTGLGTTTENAIRCAAKRLVRRLRDESERRRAKDRLSSGFNV